MTTGSITRWLAAAIFASGALPGVALAQSIEPLEQLEPGRGEWLVDYSSVYDGDDGHAIEILRGLSDHVALGAELEASEANGRIALEGVQAIGLFRITRVGSPIEIGATVQIGVDRDLRVTGGEARLIAESRRGGFRLQGNLVLRQVIGEDGTGTGTAYGVSLERKVAGGLWLGAEGSGQLFRLSGEPIAVPQGRHYAGPALTFERALGDAREIEIGFAYLCRIAGDGPHAAPLLFLQLTL